MGLESTRSNGSWWGDFKSRSLRVKSAPLLQAAERKAQQGAEVGLSRNLGAWDLILLGIGASIGSGIFVITGTVAHDAGPGAPYSILVLCSLPPSPPL